MCLLLWVTLMPIMSIFWLWDQGINLSFSDKRMSLFVRVQKGALSSRFFDNGWPHSHTHFIWTSCNITSREFRKAERSLFANLLRFATRSGKRALTLILAIKPSLARSWTKKNREPVVKQMIFPISIELALLLYCCKEITQRYASVEKWLRTFTHAPFLNSLHL